MSHTSVHQKIYIRVAIKIFRSKNLSYEYSSEITEVEAQNPQRKRSVNPDRRSAALRMAVGDYDELRLSLISGSQADH